MQVVMTYGTLLSSCAYYDVAQLLMLCQQQGLACLHNLALLQPGSISWAFHFAASVQSLDCTAGM